MPSSRDAHGRFISKETAARPTNLELGPITQRKRAAKRRATEREFLRLVIEQVGKEDVRQIAKTVVERAKKGDKDALTWVGRYLLGGGRISLDELSYPPIIRRSR